MFVSYQDVISENRKKTKIVMFIYILIYAFLGLLLDVVIYDSGNFADAMMSLITFKVIPYATISMFAIGLLTIFVAISMFAKIQLSGNEYIEIRPDDTEYGKLYNVCEELKISAGLDHMPSIYLIDAPYMNAFASGWTENNTMMAITRGLYEKLDREELAAVMAHELTHIRNEDIKLTLIVGVSTNIMLFVVSWISLVFLRGESQAAKTAKGILMVLHFVLPLLTFVLSKWLSRTREYMADSGAVELTRNPDAMASALRKISGDYDAHQYKEDSNETRKAAYFFQPGDGFFSTHPSTKNRIGKLIGIQD